MMPLKQWINNAFRFTGYQFTKTPSIDHDIASGKYRWLQEWNIATVLDVGANEGQFAETIRRILPNAAIYSFEPLRTCYEKLRTKSVSLMPMQCFPFALGKEEATTMIFHNEFSASSSMLPMAERHRDAFPHTKNATEEQITVRTLDGMGKEIRLRPPVLMKVDVQGYEINVLNGAQKTLPVIDVIIIETSFVELYNGQPLFHEIYEFLTAKGFLFMGNLEQIFDESTGAILQADSIFVNGRK